jgi:hypothetical protein
MVPAAVISMGKIFGNASAPSSTPRYPAMVAIDDSASMLCARVMRGISSMEKRNARSRQFGRFLHRRQRFAEADHDLSRRAAAADPRGPLGIRSERPHLHNNVGLLENLGARADTCRPSDILLVWKTRVDTRRLFDDYAAPSFPSVSAARGVNATRRSPGNVSRGTPIVRATSYLLTDSSQRTVKPQDFTLGSHAPGRLAAGCSQTSLKIILPFHARRYHEGIVENQRAILRRAQSLLLAVLLFLLNAYVCRGLFAVEYLRHMGSIEAAYIGISRSMLAHWRDFSWFPAWYAGIPAQNTYPPLLHWIVALVALLRGISPAHAHHWVTAIFIALDRLRSSRLHSGSADRRGRLSSQASFIPRCRHQNG